MTNSIRWLVLAALLGNTPVLAEPPDLSGVWTNSSLTRLTRPEHIDTLVLDPQTATQLASGHFHNVRARADEKPSDPDKSAPEALEALPPVGNYNAFWVDPGARYGVVDGQIRSSWIVSPADGQLPYNDHALTTLQQWRELRQGSPGPESRSVGERCLLGFGSSGGPPMLNVLYNNYYRFLQTNDHVLLQVEMVHDARIVRLKSAHLPAGASRWMGDSIGRYEDDVLVVHTTNFHPQRSHVPPVLLSPTAEIEERFQRSGTDTLKYSFKINDPVFYTESIYAEMTFQRTNDLLYEYACHEGNYGLQGILRGARVQEAAGG